MSERSLSATYPSYSGWYELAITMRQHPFKDIKIPIAASPRGFFIVGFVDIISSRVI